MSANAVANVLGVLALASGVFALVMFLRWGVATRDEDGPRRDDAGRWPWLVGGALWLGLGFVALLLRVFG